MSGRREVPEAKEALKALLKETAKQHRVITYQEAAQAHPALAKTGVLMGRQVGHLLGEINREEDAFLSAVVVQKGTLLPGPGFFGLPGAPRTLDRYNAVLRRMWKKYGP